jgi:Winged helix DNA-binding domain
VTNLERRARLAQRHRLTVSTRDDDVVGVVESVVVLHSSDPCTVFLSAMARLATPSIRMVEAALYDDRSVFRHHAMRRTVWVFTPEAARAAHVACTQPLAIREWKRLAKMVEDSEIAVDGTAWVERARHNTLAAMTEMGPTTARELGKRVPELTAKLHLAVGKPYAGTQGAHSRIIQNLGFDGLIVRGRPAKWTSGEYSWSLVDGYVRGGLTGMAVADAAALLARRYLDRFGPVTTADVQWWMGWTAGMTKQAIAAVGAVEVDLEGGSVGWLLPDDLDVVVYDEPWVGVLPALDPSIMGWQERGWYLGDLGRFGDTMFDRNGNAGPSLWVDGRVVGGWVQRPSGDIALGVLTDVPKKRRAELEASAERVRQQIGDARVNPRFPAPMQKDLLAGR